MQITNGIRLDAKDNCDYFQTNMGSFLSRAEHLKDECIQMITSVDEQFAALCLYFAAPPPPTTSPDEFFALVAKFVQTFTATVKQVDEKEARQKKAHLRDNERLTLRAKASKRPVPISSRPIHRKKLTGINFDPTQIAQEAALKKSTLKQIRKSTMTDSKRGSNLRKTIGAIQTSSRKQSMNNVGADVVLLAARRASQMMGVETKL